ncbi:MAG: methyl-accepting chemotaxis sensory transducer [Armatimonadetes bacterium]|nr:methyl-accepting chemotaxis sensory transducer [Armatimonadota bacterium]
MLGFNHWRVQHKLGLLIGVFLVGFLALGWTARNTLDTVKINSPEYHRIIQGKDLIADILPPPEYIIESYLKVFQMKDETDPVRQAALRDEFRKLRSDYEARHEVWVKELPEGELPPGRGPRRPRCGGQARAWDALPALRGPPRRDR